MKKYILLLPCLIVSLFSVAQTFSLEDDYLFAALELNSEDEYNLDINNDQDTSVVLTWEITNYDIPLSWLMQVCDNKQCYSNEDSQNIPITAEMNPIVGMGGHGWLKITPQPGDSPYYATLEFDIYETNNPDIVLHMTFQFNAGDVSVSEELIDRSITLYPNPSQNGTCTVSIDNEAIDQMRIFDLQGRLVSNTSISQNTTDIDTSQMESGTYVVVFEGEGVVISRRKLVVG